MSSSAAFPPRSTESWLGPAASAPFAMIEMRQRSFSSIDANEWDTVALASGGSFLGCWKVLESRRFFERIELCDFVVPNASGNRLKLGQCALRVTPRKVIFLDSIHLKPEHKHFRSKCLQLVMDRFGARTYQYGSQWNHEEPFEVGPLPGYASELLRQKPFHIDILDLRDWDGFSAYCRAISENIRRDYNKARSACPRFATRRGITAFPALPALVSLRRHVMRKNKEPFSPLADFILHAVKLLIFRNNAFISTVSKNGKYFATFFGTEFGDNLFYNTGGTLENRSGFGSYLFLTLIENWFSQHPAGKIFMGDCQGLADPCSYRSGALLYRRKLRVRSVPGFQFQLLVKPVA